MQIEIYSDVACPWCYIGERRFSRALAKFNGKNDVEVVFRPFQLDPSLPERPQPLKERLQKKFGFQTDALIQRVTSVGEQEGIDFHFKKAQAVNTFTAHRLLWLAEQEAGPETQRELAERLFAAHFTDGENIADPEFLADLAESAGMDRERVEAFLASDEGVAEVRKQIEYAQRLGLRAVPTFVFNGESAVQGAQPTSTFLQVLEELQQEAAEADKT